MNKAKEKAQELVNMFIEFQYKFNNSNLIDNKTYAKKCSLICCDEIINLVKIFPAADFWHEVKSEIEKL